MTKSRVRILIILIILILGSVGCAFWLTDNNTVEIRSDFLESLLQGALTIWLLTFFFFLITIWILESDTIRKRFIIFFPVVAIYGIAFTILLIAGIFFTSFKRDSSTDDVIIYKSKVNDKEKLVFQCWWAGIGGGNAHWRIIKTDKLNLLIRPISVDTSQYLIRQMELGESYELKPKFDSIYYKNASYILESYLVIENGLIQRIKINAR